MTHLGVWRIERLTRDLLAAYGLPATLLVVLDEPPRWLIVIQEDSKRIFDLEVPDAIGVGDVRAQLQQQLLTLLNFRPSTERHL